MLSDEKKKDVKKRKKTIDKQNSTWYNPWVKQRRTTRSHRAAMRVSVNRHGHLRGSFV